MFVEQGIRFDLLAATVPPFPDSLKQPEQKFTTPPSKTFSDSEQYLRKQYS